MQLLVFGASGYSGLELLRLLARHPHARVVAASSNRWASQPVRQHVRTWRGDLCFERHDAVLEAAQAGQIALLATPAQTSAELAPQLIERGLRVIDLSGAFRLRDAATHKLWYGFEHPRPDLLRQAQYGLPELLSIDADTQLVANPGCYASACILAAAPLVQHKLLVAGAPIMADGKSGVTGAGRSLQDALLYSEVDESLRPYRVGQHQHTPEIEQALQRLSGQEVKVSFTAHLIPMRRGLLVSVYVPVVPHTSQEMIEAAYAQAFGEQTFVTWVDRPPETGRVKHDNFAEVYARLDPRTQTVSAFCAIDNLVKGAAGQAVQNLNTLMGLPQDTALLAPNFAEESGHAY